MAKFTPGTLVGGFSDKDSLNATLTDVADQLNNKVLYRDNPTGEPNQLQSDIDVNCHKL